MHDLFAKQNGSVTRVYSPTESIVYLGLFIWPQEHQFYFLGAQIDLPPTLFTAMHLLMRKPYAYHNRNQLCEVMNPDTYNSNIDSHIKRIRQRLCRVHPSGSAVIITKPRVGYRLWQRTDFNEQTQNAD